MGWESGVTLGAGAVGAYANTQNAEEASSAIAQSAENNAQNIANKTSRNLGSLETSFIRGGIALTGAGGPAAVFQQAAQQGATDIQRTIANANASISDTMNKARSKSLDTLATTWSKAGPGFVDEARMAWNGMEVGNLDPAADASLPWSTNYKGWA